MPLRVAIVGSGVSGLAALWTLQQQQKQKQQHDEEDEIETHLYEADDRVGGHTLTVPWRNLSKAGGVTMVDIAFTLYNKLTYPNFTSLLSHLNIASLPMRITFGLSRDNGQFEWSSTSLSTFFAQRRNLLSPSVWRMLFDIWRFNLFATDILHHNNNKYNPLNQNHNQNLKSQQKEEEEESVGSYLKRNNYSSTFRDNYLIPLASSIWVNDPNQTLNSIPILMLVAYFKNHLLLNSSFGDDGVQWLVIKDGAKQYVDRILEGLPVGNLHVSTPIVKVESDCRVEGRGASLLLHTADGSIERFDRVIVATAGDEALRILGDGATDDERRILGCFRTSPSRVFLHSDTSFMPRNRKAWSAWNYHDFSTSVPSGPHVSLTANLNDLPGQDISITGPILTTLNPCRVPDPSSIQGTFYFRHPVYDSASMQAQNELHQIQGRRGIWFAGAWMREGFHEQGFTAGVKAAMDIWPEVKLPFPIVDCPSPEEERMKLSMEGHRLPGLMRLLRLSTHAVQYSIVFGLLIGRVVMFLFGTIYSEYFVAARANARAKAKAKRV
ncbi:hypothetical protein DTO280E4_267 [Paecilomyces variotii]|nr:hypothetical protein DTO280E4_267 [Paecilomyces variotii]